MRRSPRDTGAVTGAALWAVLCDSWQSSERGHAGRDRAAGDGVALEVHEFARLDALEQRAVRVLAELLALRPQGPAVAVQLEPHALRVRERLANALSARDAHARALEGAHLGAVRGEHVLVADEREAPGVQHGVGVSQAGLQLRAEPRGVVGVQGHDLERHEERC